MDNFFIANALEEMGKAYDILGETYRAKAYLVASLSVRALPYKLADYPPGARKVRGVGQGIADKINEILQTGRCQELERLRGDPRITAARTLMALPGVGPVTAQRWIAAGINSIETLREAHSAGRIRLTPPQELGLKYYSDISRRLPREVVTAVSSELGRIVASVCPGCTFTVAGSYRRGAPDSGDIDILVTGDMAKNTDQGQAGGFIDQLRARILNNPNYIGELFGGAERLTFLYRTQAAPAVAQIDILFVAPESYWAAVLYFTGSWEFNQEMRSWAAARGYRLNQNGLYKTRRAAGLTRENLVHVTSEADIFRELSLRYVEPPARVAGALNQI